MSRFRVLATGMTLSLALIGCAASPGSAQGPSTDGARTSRNALDWPGAYRGVLPCADCEGIDTVVMLDRDGGYRLETRYLGEDGLTTSTQGRFTWDAGGSVVTLEGETPAKYQVGENRLTQLHLDGSPITGVLADHYVLAKQSDDIREKYWKLVELNGRPTPKLEREPHLILKSAGDRVVGFGGCNSFTGAYTLDAASARISFGRIASTMMACPAGMDVEREFHAVLERADNYSLAGDHLTLNRARMAPLARFEAVYLR